MEITRYLNGVEISKNELYEIKIETPELVDAIQEAGKRYNNVQKVNPENKNINE